MTFLSPKDLDDAKINKSILSGNGDILYKDGTGSLAPLHPGTQGQVLTIGTSGVPEYADLPSGNPLVPSMVSGLDTFNSTTGKTITLNPPLPDANYKVIITPNQDPSGFLGEVWVEDLQTTQFTVKNSGSNNTTSFMWIVLY